LDGGTIRVRIYYTERFVMSTAVAVCLNADAVKEVAKLCRTFAPMTDFNWGSLISTSEGFFMDEPGQRRMVTTLPRSVTEAAELVWVHIHPHDFASKTLIVKALRNELEPSIMGVGEVILHETAEGVVVVSKNSREWIFIAHREAS
jgi:hypothetical protein